MSGEDQRHSYHTIAEIEALVDSREELEDGRIVETSPEDPEGNPPNVIRGNNANLPA